MGTTANRSFTNLPFFFILLCSCLIAYWPLSLSLFSLKNDALNYFLPVRHLISESITNGRGPFWSPYLNLGYPLHGDMQSGVWNPFVQLFSLFGTYTIRTLQYETLLYVYLSGIGMFLLCDFIFRDKAISLLCAVAYMLCGYNSDCAQFLNWISSASFIPLVLLFYYRCLVEQTWKFALLTALFFYLLFVTAYPADFILMIYLMGGMALVYIIKKRVWTERKKVHKLVVLHTLLLVVFMTLALPAILSYYEFLPLSERGTGTSYENAMSNSYHPLLISSYVAPLGVWKAPYVGITDPLERNSFIGIIPFILLLISFFIKTDNKLFGFSRWAFLIFLVFSLGEFGGLRVLAYYFLPLMNTFRHPANARIFTTVFGCLLAGFALKDICGDKVIWSRKAKMSFLITFSLFLLFIVICASAVKQRTNVIDFVKLFSSNVIQLKSLLDQLSFSGLVYFNVLLQLPFLLIFYFAFIKKISFKWLLAASILNSIIHTALFQPFTVIKKDSVRSIQKKLDNAQVKGYPLPDAKSTIQLNSKEGYLYFNEIGALNLYNKRIGRIDYRITPSNLLIQNEFWLNEKLRNDILQYPIIFKADTALLMRDFDKPINKKIVLLEDTTLILHINKSMKGTFKAAFTSFTPNQFSLEIDSDQDGFYSVFQNHYPRWRLQIDRASYPIIRTNVSFMGFWLTKGKHKIDFRYKTLDLEIAWFVSLLSSIIIIALLIVQKIKVSFLL